MFLLKFFSSIPGMNAAFDFYVAISYLLQVDTALTPHNDYDCIVIIIIICRECVWGPLNPLNEILSFGI